MGRGPYKAKFLEALYENKQEFPLVRGVQKKKLSMGGVRIFFGTAQSQSQIKVFTVFGFEQ